MHILPCAVCTHSSWYPLPSRIDITSESRWDYVRRPTGAPACQMLLWSHYYAYCISPLKWGFCLCLCLCNPSFQSIHAQWFSRPKGKPLFEKCPVYLHLVLTRQAYTPHPKEPNRKCTSLTRYFIYFDQLKWPKWRSNFAPWYTCWHLVINSPWPEQTPNTSNLQTIYCDNC